MLELLARPMGNHPSLVDHHDPLREGLCLLHHLCGQQHRGPGGNQLLDELPDVVAGARVWSAGGRLVQEQDRWRAIRLAPISGRRRVPPEYVFTSGSAAPVSAKRFEVLPAGQQLIDRRVLLARPIPPRGGRAWVTTS